MSLTVSGDVYDKSGIHTISSATVRLYRKDTGAYIDGTTSDTLGEWSITGLDDYDPYKLFAVAYTDNYQAGIADIKKLYHNLTYQIYADLMDTNTDLITIDVPSIHARVLKVIVESTQNATVEGQIDVRTAADGGGSGISVTLTTGTNWWSNTGDLTSTDYFFIRSVTPGDGMQNLNITLRFENPYIVKPLGGD